MLRKIGLKTVIAAVIVLISLSVQAFARNSVTCSGGWLYVEQTGPDGDEICWDTRLTCSGEWSYSWMVAKPGDKSNPATAIQSSSVRLSAEAAEKNQAAQLLSKVKKSEMQLFYKAPSSVVASFKSRAGWPNKDKGPIVLPPSSPGPTFPDPPVENLKAKGYPPKGYPCLGCEPCPPPAGAFCDIVWNKRSAARSSSGGGLSENDLSPGLAAKGYIVKDGKIMQAEKSKAPMTIKNNK